MKLKGKNRHYIQDMSSNGRNPYFWVRVPKPNGKSKKDLLKTRTFSYGTSRTRQEALALAVEYRDQTMKKHGVVFGNGRGNRNKGNNTGVEGVIKGTDSRGATYFRVNWVEGPAGARAPRSKQFRYYAKNETEKFEEAKAFRLKMVSLHSLDKQLKTKAIQPKTDLEGINMAAMTLDIDDLINRLTTKARAKVIFKRLSIRQLGLVMESITEVRREKEEEERQRFAKIQEQQKAVEAARKLLEAAGIGLDDNALLTDVEIPKPKREMNVNKQRYKVTDKNGVIRYWSGCGHMPKQMKEIIEHGASLKGKNKKKIVQENFLLGHDFLWHKAFTCTDKCEIPETQQELEVA